jgi:hypothetical protein
MDRRLPPRGRCAGRPAARPARDPRGRIDGLGAVARRLPLDLRRPRGGLWLLSISGGTDLCTAFVAGTPTLSVVSGELQARALGASVDAWDADGRSLTGAVGELVITRAMPSMPIGFWGDEDGARLRATYFADYPGVWRHGDWIEITDRGTVLDALEVPVKRILMGQPVDEVVSRGTLANPHALDAFAALRDAPAQPKVNA